LKRDFTLEAHSGGEYGAQDIQKTLSKMRSIKLKKMQVLK
jgi:hypothetical protein